MVSSVELVHRSATRRKACVGCVRAKRRCDLTFPSCSRCAARLISCQYADSHSVGTAERQSQLRTHSSQSDSSPKTLPHTSLSPTTIKLPNISWVSSLGSTVPITPYDSFSYPERVSLEQNQLEYCTFELKQSVVTLVLEGRAPFIHPDLYQDTMPEAYQDLLAICSIYNQKTAHNSTVVFRMLFIKLKKLIAFSRSITKAEDWLLAVQSLILYQIIRLFDSDDQQRLTAEGDFRLLEEWTGTLQKHYGEPDPLHFGTPRRRWIFNESVRRTILMSVFLHCVYDAWTEGATELVPLLGQLPVSENTAGWDQQALEIVDEKQALVPYHNFVNDWNDGNVKILGAYEMLLLKACRVAMGAVDPYFGESIFGSQEWL